MLSIVTLPQANEDSDVFFLYLAEDSPRTANRFLDKLEETLSLIANFPQLASVFESENIELQGMGWFPVNDFPNHLIFYIPDDSQITVVRILHKAQNIMHILIER